MLEPDEHLPCDAFFSTLPLKYDSNATCRAIDRVLSEVIPAQELAFYEIGDYCRYREYPLLKVFPFIEDECDARARQTIEQSIYENTHKQLHILTRYM